MLDSITLPGIGSGVSVASISTRDYALARLQWVDAFGTDPKTVSISRLRDGEYEMRQFDLETGSVKTSAVKIEGAAIRGYVPYALDEGLALFAGRE
jgi:hypothetical protein